MMYHSQSFAQHGFETFIIGYGGKVHDKFLQHCKCTVYAKATWLLSRWQSLRLGANKAVTLATSRSLPVSRYAAWVYFKGSEIALPNLRATESYIPNAGCATCFVGTPAIHSRIYYCTSECLRFGYMVTFMDSVLTKLP